MAKQETTALTPMDRARQKFELACRDAASLDLANNAIAAFTAANVIVQLRDALTPEVMEHVFMPLMNTRVGFLTDRTGRPDKRGQALPSYTTAEVREAIIDAICFGLLPTGNQFNIIAGRMYPTKEGYAALLKKIPGLNYQIAPGVDDGSNPNFALINCKISYKIVDPSTGEVKAEKSYSQTFPVKKDSYSSQDQLRGKAERKARKALYEYITGCSLGDADPDDQTPADVTATAVENEVREQANRGGAMKFAGDGVPEAQAQPASPEPAAQQPASPEPETPVRGTTPRMPGF